MLKTQDYLDLVERHRKEKEIEAFPIAYAFDNKQLKRALEKLGANDISECVTPCQIHVDGNQYIRSNISRCEKSPTFRRYGKSIVYDKIRFVI